jgi:hypothetical protein
MGDISQGVAKQYIQKYKFISRARKCADVSLYTFQQCLNECPPPPPPAPRGNEIQDPAVALQRNMIFTLKGLCRWFRFAQLAKGKKSRP